MSICSTIHLNFKYSHFEATQKQMLQDIDLYLFNIIKIKWYENTVLTYIIIQKVRWGILL